MPTLTLLRFEEGLRVSSICQAMDGARKGDMWFEARPSRYNREEAIVKCWYWEDIEVALKRALGEEGDEVISFLKENGRRKVLKRVYCFLNTSTKILEVYRGPDPRTQAIIVALSELLSIKLSPIRMSSAQLRQVYEGHSTELCQAIFKGVHGLIYDILRGRKLELNPKFRQYMREFEDCLRVISFRPRIRFLNSLNRYQVTLNGDRGTLRIPNNELGWRPRFEIRQIVFSITTALAQS
jgi:hypothetical protein